MIPAPFVETVVNAGELVLLATVVVVVGRLVVVVEVDVLVFAGVVVVVGAVFVVVVVVVAVVVVVLIVGNGHPYASLAPATGVGLFVGNVYVLGMFPHATKSPSVPKA